MGHMLKRAAHAVAALALAASLGACGGLSFSDLNPFADKETPLPGKREPVMTATDPLQVDGAARTAVTLPPETGNEDWAQPGGPPSNAPGNLAFSGAASRGWRVGAVSGSDDTRLAISPIVYQGRIYVVDTAGDLSAFNAANGARLWKVSVRPEHEDDDGVVGGGAAAEGGRVYLVSGYGIVAAFDAGSGAEAWRVDMKIPARSAPTAANGKLYLVTTENKIVALNTADGSEAWQYRGIAETTGLLADASPAVAGGTLVVPYTSGEIVAFDAETGDPKWADSLARAARFSSVTGINAVAGRPAIDRGVVYAVSISGRLIASDVKTGERIWSRNIASTNTPVVAGESVFVNSIDNRLVAFSRTTGEVQWVTDLPKAEKKKDRLIWTGPVLGGGRLWLVSSNEKLMSVDASTGKILGEADLGDPVYIPPVIASGRMIILTDKGSLLAYN